MSQSPFYVGYLPLPAGSRRFVRGMVAAAASLAIAGALLFALTQPPSGDGSWADDTIELDGVLTAAPYAILHGHDPESGRPRAWLLVSSGKAGALDRAQAALAGADHRRVRVRGTALRRQGQCALELIDGPAAIEVLGDAAPIPIETRSSVTLVGEIIDPKCWLGAMRPGSGLVHRACASLCIRGGVPPCFIGGSPGAPPSFWVLTDRDARACNDAVAELAGTLVRVEGVAARQGTVEWLRVDPATIREVSASQSK